MKTKLNLREFSHFTQKQIYISILVILSFISISGCDWKKSASAEVVKADQVDEPGSCPSISWSPEVITFFGDAATINRKLESSQMNLLNRRMYIMAIETESGSTIKLYERTHNGTVAVQEWSGNEATSFITQANSSILANKGIACVGEQTQAIFSKMNLKNLGEIPAPVSAQAAFSHDIKNKVAPYLKVTVFLLC